jgi:hypothetical protein
MVVHLDDVVVSEIDHDSRFALEPFRERLLGRNTELFDDDRTLEGGVERFKNVSHSALADFSDYMIFAYGFNLFFCHASSVFSDRD